VANSDKVQLSAYSLAESKIQVRNIDPELISGF